MNNLWNLDYTVTTILVPNLFRKPCFRSVLENSKVKRTPLTLQNQSPKAVASQVVQPTIILWNSINRTTGVQLFYFRIGGYLYKDDLHLLSLKVPHLTKEIKETIL